MSRLAITLSCGFFVAATLSTGVWAAGRGLGPAAPMSIGHGRVLAGHPVQVVRPVQGFRPWRGAGRGALGWHHRRFGWNSPGYSWPGYGFDYGFDAPTGGVTIVEQQAEPTQPIDPNSFENLMPRAGIQPSPTPEPTIYRLEGPRSRPVTRIIRIAGADDAREGARSRYAHAETGALLLTVPRR